MKKLLMAIILSFFANGLVFANDWRPKDFAYGIPVIPKPAAPVARVTVPDEVYRYAHRPDLGDTRVFNHQGRIVSHMIRDPKIRTSKELSKVPIPLYPLPPQVKSGADYQVYVKADEKGAIVDIQRDGVAPSDGNPPGSYLLDINRFTRSFRELSLTWSETKSGFLSKATIDASEDLETWTTVKRDVTLADLPYGSAHLVRNTISLPRKRYRYLRLTWEGSNPEVAIQSVLGEFYPRFAPPVRLETLVPVSGADKKKGLYTFDTGGFFPVIHVRLAFAQTNTMMRGTWHSRPDPETPWRMRGSGLFYSLMVKGSLFESKAIGVNKVADRYWQFRVDPSATGSVGEPLQMVIGYEPKELLFIAQGEAPFTIAFGNALAAPVDAPLNSLLKSVRKKDRDDLVQEAALGKRFTLGGEQRLSKSWKSADWKSWLLWSVMVCGVLLIGVMAWRLYSKMNEDAKG